MALLPGQKLSFYEILGPLGAGGMGEVFRARDTRLEREVAIKVLPAGLADDADRLMRFEREAKTLASLNHSNVGAIYGVDHVGGTYFLALELVPGEDLAKRLSRGAMPVDEAVGVCRQVAEGLEAAHEAGVVHRDLKPANVRITPEGVVKLLDFGLAKPIRPTAGGGMASAEDPDGLPATEEGLVLGTPTYMSPEQARGKPVDKRTDVWAFGCVLYECLTGRRAFGGATVSDVLASVLEREPDWAALPASTPGHVRQLLRRCLEKDPRRRLRDVGDAGLMLVGDPEVPAPQTAVRSRSSPVWWIVTGLGLLAAFLLGTSMDLLRAPQGPPRVTQLTFSGRDHQPHVSPDGRLIAFTSSRAGISQVWLRQVVGGGEQPLTEGPDWRPRFTADGAAVTFIRSLGRAYAAYRVPTVGGQPRKLIEDVAEVDSSPDGRSLAFIRGAAVGDMELGSQLGILDLETGKERHLLTSTGFDLLGLSWSPDGSRICVTKAGIQGASGDYRTLLVDPLSGQAREFDVTGEHGTVSAATWAGPTSLVLAISPKAVSGTPVPGPIIRYDLRSGRTHELLWARHLFPFRGALNTATRLALIDDHSLAFDAFVQTEELHELGTGPGAAPEQRLLEGPAMDRQPTYHPDGGRILFSSNRTGNVDLFSYEIATGRLRQLTDHPGSDWDPAYTPDGRSILWGSNRSGSLEIWTADVDGTHARQLTRDGAAAENPTMTRDGEWVLYSSGNPAHPGIFRIRSDGTDSQRLLAGNWVQPDVSPDGRYVLYIGADNALLVNTVRVLDLQTGEGTAFEAEISYDLRSPNVTYGRGRWTPEGDAIVFVGIDPEGHTGLWIQDFDPGRDTRPTRRPLVGFDGRHVYESFGIAPEGQRITAAFLEQVRMIMKAEQLPAMR